jgi:hypothetical protein
MQQNEKDERGPCPFRDSRMITSSSSHGRNRSLKRKAPLCFRVKENNCVNVPIFGR